MAAVKLDHGVVRVTDLDVDAALEAAKSTVRSPMCFRVRASPTVNRSLLGRVHPSRKILRW